MFKEGNLTLPIPQTSRKRGDTSLPFPQSSLSRPSYQLRKQHPLLLVLSDQERNWGEASLGSWSEEREPGEESQFSRLTGTQFPQERGHSPMTLVAVGRSGKELGQAPETILDNPPFLGERDQDQGGLLQLAPQNLPPSHTVNIFKSKAGREESKKQYFSSHAKNGDREEWQAQAPLSVPWGFPSAHLNMVLGRGDTWVLTSKQGRPQPLDRGPFIFYSDQPF